MNIGMWLLIKDWKSTPCIHTQMTNDCNDFFFYLRRVWFRLCEVYQLWFLCFLGLCMWPGGSLRWRERWDSMWLVFSRVHKTRVMILDTYWHEYISRERCDSMWLVLTRVHKTWAMILDTYWHEYINRERWDSMWLVLTRVYKTRVMRLYAVSIDKST
jgi:hypothetical protein